MKWVKNYLYTQLKPTAKLEILTVNENVRARYIAADRMRRAKPQEEREQFTRKK